MKYCVFPCELSKFREEKNTHNTTQHKIWHSFRSVVLGMGDGSMTTLTIADPEKDGIRNMQNRIKQS